MGWEYVNHEHFQNKRENFVRLKELKTFFSIMGRFFYYKIFCFLLKYIIAEMFMEMGSENGEIPKYSS